MGNYKSFTQYLTESSKHAVFTFGRFNPPTTGHEKLIEKLASVASGSDYFVYASQSNDAKKNPLEYSAKVKYMRKMFPKHARNIILDKTAKNVFDILNKLYEKDYISVTMVVGSDRISEFEVLANKYNGVKARHGFYNFETINVVSAGERDPDAEGVSGMSASKMRAAAADNNFGSFSKGLPKSFKGGKELFNDLRKGMGLTESTFRPHVKLKTVSDIREAYVSEKIFKKGDYVNFKESNEVGKIIVRGSNYVIVETKDRKERKWLEDILPLEEKLTTENKLEDWIENYINSVSERFDGKSKKDRIKMAILEYKDKQLAGY